MRRRVLWGLFGVVLASCATVPASTCAPAPRGVACLRRASAAAVRTGRPRDSDGLSPAQVKAMLRDFTQTLRRRYGVADERQLESSRRLAGRIVVPVRFHVITDGRSGRLTTATIDQQIRSLNAAYGGTTGGADTGVSFRLVSADVVRNTDWFERPHELQGPMLGALVRGGPGTLNLFTAAVGSQVLGFSAFPQAYRLHPTLDAVVVDYRSVPGGSFAHFNRGYTAVHETGHWLGLFHPFENGCVPPGDGVDDTPYESTPTTNCPSAKDSCPQPGTDLVHNFMDYAWDPCMTSFTPGQGLRIRAMWAAYRAGGSGARLSLGQVRRQR
ncbi:zinc metalloprotease [Actinoallomurus oryzae]|uniref:Zinc metalloprotease n=1 Tax=Actinoallomurus oryzae TaxID=502180 RepID=A0ABP8QR61_9ACTN